MYRLGDDSNVMPPPAGGNDLAIIDAALSSPIPFPPKIAPNIRKGPQEFAQVLLDS